MLGLSIPELVLMRTLRDRAVAVLRAKAAGDEAKGESADSEAVASCIDALARAIWRMEALHPELLVADEAAVRDRLADFEEHVGGEVLDQSEEGEKGDEDGP